MPDDTTTVKLDGTSVAVSSADDALTLTITRKKAPKRLPEDKGEADFAMAKWEQESAIRVQLLADCMKHVLRAEGYKLNTRWHHDETGGAVRRISITAVKAAEGAGERAPDRVVRDTLDKIYKAVAKAKRELHQDGELDFWQVVRRVQHESKLPRRFTEALETERAEDPQRAGASEPRLRVPGSFAEAEAVPERYIGGSAVRIAVGGVLIEEPALGDKLMPAISAVMTAVSDAAGRHLQQPAPDTGLRAEDEFLPASLPRDTLREAVLSGLTTAGVDEGRRATLTDGITAKVGNLRPKTSFKAVG